MEQKAHYALVGSFVILALIATVIFASWLSNAQFDQQYDDYIVEFNGPVRGVSQGSDVRLTGLTVGSVTGLSFEPNNPSVVQVRIQVVADTPVFVDAYAQLEPQGLTGLSYIQIFPGDTAKPRMRQSKREPALIEGRMSQIDTFIDSGSTIIEGARSSIGRLNKVFDDEGIANLQIAFKNISELTEKANQVELDPKLINSTLVAIKTSANDVSVAAKSLNQVVNDFDQFVKVDLNDLVARSTVTLSKTDSMIDSFKNVADGGTELTVDVRDAINRLSNSGLADVEETLNGLLRFVNSLNSIVEGLEQNPGAFLAGQERQVMELPQ